MQPQALRVNASATVDVGALRNMQLVSPTSAHNNAGAPVSNAWPSPNPALGEGSAASSAVRSRSRLLFSAADAPPPRSFEETVLEADLPLVDAAALLAAQDPDQIAQETGRFWVRHMLRAHESTQSATSRQRAEKLAVFLADAVTQLRAACEAQGVSQHAKLEHERRIYDVVFADLSQQVAGYSASHSFLLNEVISHYRGAIRAFPTMLDEKDDTILTLEATKTTLEQSLKELGEAHAQAEARVEELGSDLADTRRRLAQRSHDVAAMRRLLQGSSRAEAQALADAQDLNVARLRNISQTDDKHSALTRKARSLQEANQLLRRQSEEALRKVVAAEAARKSATEAEEELRGQVAELRAAAEALGADVGFMEAETKRLRREARLNTAAAEEEREAKERAVQQLRDLAARHEAFKHAHAMRKGSGGDGTGTGDSKEGRQSNRGSDAGGSTSGGTTPSSARGTNWELEVALNSAQQQAAALTSKLKKAQASVVDGNRRLAEAQRRAHAAHQEARSRALEAETVAETLRRRLAAAESELEAQADAARGTADGGRRKVHTLQDKASRDARQHLKRAKSRRGSLQARNTSAASLTALERLKDCRNMARVQVERELSSFSDDLTEVSTKIGHAMHLALTRPRHGVIAALKKHSEDTSKLRKLHRNIKKDVRAMSASLNTAVATVAHDMSRRIKKQFAEQRAVQAMHEAKVQQLRDEVESVKHTAEVKLREVHLQAARELRAAVTAASDQARTEATEAAAEALLDARTEVNALRSKLEETRSLAAHSSARAAAMAADIRRTSSRPDVTGSVASDSGPSAKDSVPPPPAPPPTEDPEQAAEREAAARRRARLEAKRQLAAEAVAKAHAEAAEAERIARERKAAEEAEKRRKEEEERRQQQRRERLQRLQEDAERERVALERKRAEEEEAKQRADAARRAEEERVAAEEAERVKQQEEARLARERLMAEREAEEERAMEATHAAINAAEGRVGSLELKVTKKTHGAAGASSKASTFVKKAGSKTGSKTGAKAESKTVTTAAAKTTQASSVASEKPERAIMKRLRAGLGSSRSVVSVPSAQKAASTAGALPAIPDTVPEGGDDVPHTSNTVGGVSVTNTKPGKEGSQARPQPTVATATTARATEGQAGVMQRDPAATSTSAMAPSERQQSTDRHVNKAVATAQSVTPATKRTAQGLAPSSGEATRTAIREDAPIAATQSPLLPQGQQHVPASSTGQANLPASDALHQPGTANVAALSQGGAVSVPTARQAGVSGRTSSATLPRPQQDAAARGASAPTASVPGSSMVGSGATQHLDGQDSSSQPTHTAPESAQAAQQRGGKMVKLTESRDSSHNGTQRSASVGASLIAASSRVSQPEKETTRPSSREFVDLSETIRAAAHGITSPLERQRQQARHTAAVVHQLVEKAQPGPSQATPPSRQGRRASSICLADSTPVPERIQRARLASRGSPSSHQRDEARPHRSALTETVSKQPATPQHNATVARTRASFASTPLPPQLPRAPLTLRHGVTVGDTRSVTSEDKILHSTAPMGPKAQAAALRKAMGQSRVLRSTPSAALASQQSRGVAVEATVSIAAPKKEAPTSTVGEQLSISVVQGDGVTQVDPGTSPPPTPEHEYVQAWSWFGTCADVVWELVVVCVCAFYLCAMADDVGNDDKQQCREW